MFGTMQKSADWRIERFIMKCLNVPGRRSHCGSGKLDFLQYFKPFEDTNFVA
jgi:hypothetical protein